MEKKSFKEALLSGPGPQTKQETLLLYLKGLLMGTADLVPGVSGGTVAFVSGIYENLLDAVSSFDKAFFKDIFSFRFKEALTRAHFRFLIPLVLGIGTAIFSLARLMHYLMANHPHQTWGLFFGLICASILIVGKTLESPSSPKSLLFIFVGGLFGYALVSLIPVTTPESLWFIFLCGIIGITAMILPGLSGSFLLLILGKYAYVTGALKNPLDGSNAIILLVFLSGMIVGILSFSKVLRFLLKNYRELTMSFLTGLLIGSLKKIWPWKNVLEKTMIRGKERVLREELFFPKEMTNEVSLVFLLMILGFVAILLIEGQAQKKKDLLEA
jgi:putative membrane protein